MSKDPFEELFGPLVNDADDSVAAGDTPTAPLPTVRPASTGLGGQTGDPSGIRRRQGMQSAQPTTPGEGVSPAPMPARQPLAREQAERVMNSQAAGTQNSGSGSERKLIPWIIVGAVAVIAIVGSIFVVNALKPDAAPEAAPTETVTQPAEPAPVTPEVTPTTPEEPEDEPEEEEKAEDQVPQVEVGPTNMMPIGPWNATSELSQRIGSASFNIPDGVNLELNADLMASFPASCGYSATAWGATKLDNGTFELRKPAESCEAAPELYDEVWGLMAAWVETIKVS